MRYLLNTTAVLAMAGSMVCAAAPAFAGADEAQRDSFWGKQAVQDPAYANQRQFLQVDPRDAKADPNADSSVSQADAANPYYNHSMGTMSGPNAVAQTQTPATSNNGRYTATYQQPYMKMDPRDAKVNSDASSAESKDIYYYHSMGTMGRP